MPGVPMMVPPPPIPVFPNRSSKREQEYKTEQHVVVEPGKTTGVELGISIVLALIITVCLVTFMGMNHG